MVIGTLSLFFLNPLCSVGFANSYPGYSPAVCFHTEQTISSPTLRGLPFRTRLSSTPFRDSRCTFLYKIGFAQDCPRLSLSFVRGFPELERLSIRITPERGLYFNPDCGVNLDLSLMPFLALYSIRVATSYPGLNPAHSFP